VGVESSDLWLILLNGVVIGMLLVILLRWIGHKLLRTNRKKGSDGDG